MSETLEERLRDAARRVRAADNFGDKASAAIDLEALVAELLTRDTIEISAAVALGDSFQPYGQITAGDPAPDGALAGRLTVGVYESLHEPGVVVVDVDGEITTVRGPDGKISRGVRVVLNDIDLWDPLRGEHMNDVWPLTIRRENAPDDTIWACCVSTIGPVCQHQTFPANEEER